MIFFPPIRIYVRNKYFSSLRENIYDFLENIKTNIRVCKRNCELYLHPYEASSYSNNGKATTTRIQFEFSTIKFKKKSL